MRNIDYRVYEKNFRNINHLGSFKAEKKLDVKEKCFIRIETKDRVIAVETKAAVTVPLNKAQMSTGFVIGFVNETNNTVLSLNLIG